MFENTIFTDVLATEAINGHDGFNFQAVSAGIDGTDQRNIIEFMLHEVSRKWPLEADPLAHPETFAHIVQDGKHYISRGKSTGETNTGRRGNQLTQTIVIPFEDYDRYEHGFPSQLFASSHWSIEKATSKVASVWEDTGIDETEPLDEQNEVLLEWAKTTPWVSQRLADFISVLNQAFAESANGQKIVILYNNIEEFIRWVSLASLLIDGEKPMSLEFKAGVDSPWNSRGHILGIPCELQGEDLSGAFVIDTINETMGTTDVDQASRTVAEWFLNQDLGDAQTKNDILRRWSPIMGPELSAWGATVAAAEPVIGENFGWKGSLKLLGALGEANLTEDLELYAADFLAAVESSTLQTAEDFSDAARAAKALVEVGQEEYASSVLKVGLKNLGYKPQMIDHWAIPLVESMNWNWVQAAESRAYFATELCNLLQTTESNPHAMTYVMILLKPLHDDLNPQQIESVLQRGIDCVEEHPEVQHSLDHWIFGEAIALQRVSDIYEQAIENLKTWRKTSDSLQGFNVFTEIVKGTWEPLYSIAPATDDIQKKQRMLDTLKHALILSSEPADSRIPHLEKVPVQLQKVALNGTNPRQNPKLWATWLSTHKVEKETLELVTHELLSDLESREPTKEIKRWAPITKALESYQEHSSVFSAINLYNQKVKEIDTPLKKVSRFLGFGAGKEAKQGKTETKES